MVVRIAVLSDLHLEFDRGHQETPAAVNLAERPRRSKSGSRVALEAAGHPPYGPTLGGIEGACDLIVLAGDVDIGSHAFEYAVQVRAWSGVPVVLVAGNHEFYGQDQPTTTAHLQAHTGTCDGIAFLENERADFVMEGTSVRVLGCTLWTDFALFGHDRRDEALAHARAGMADFSGTVGFGSDVFQPVHALEIHRRSRHWLETELAVPFEGITVIVTHHAPSFRSVSPHFRGDLLSAAYASNLDDLVAGSGAALWVHGHTHESFDYSIGDTRVLCNPRGYTPFALNKRFRPGLVVDLTRTHAHAPAPTLT